MSPCGFLRGRCGTAHFCPHRLPTLSIELLDEYVLEHLQPELLAELQARNEMGDQVSLSNERATLQRSLAAAKGRLETELPRYMGKVSPEMVGKMEDEVNREIDSCYARLKSIERTLSAGSKLVSGLQALRNLPVAAKRDVLRAVIRWIAIIPSDPTRTRRRSPNGTRQPTQKRQPLQLPSDEGRLVVLTAWGTLHSAVIYRDITPDHHMPITYIRPAEPWESVGTVSDLPNLPCFLTEIEHSYIAVRRPFIREEFAPAALLRGDDGVATFDVTMIPVTIGSEGQVTNEGEQPSCLATT